MIIAALYYGKTAKREGAISHRHFTPSLTLFPSLSFVKHVTQQALTSQDSGTGLRGVGRKSKRKLLRVSLMYLTRTLKYAVLRYSSYNSQTHTIAVRQMGHARPADERARRIQSRRICGRTAHTTHEHVGVFALTVVHVYVR